jgi:hypothetical protein
MIMFVQIFECPDYLITDEGKLISLKRGRWRELTSVKMPNGYYKVELFHNSKQSMRYIHRLVANAFISNKHPELQTEVNHINGDKKDNRCSNLEWVSHRDNMKHAYKLGLIVNSGEKNPMSKLLDTQVKQIRSLKDTGITIREVAEQFKVSRSAISLIWRGKRHKLRNSV